MEVDGELKAGGRSGIAGVCEDEDGVDIVGGVVEANAPFLSQGFGGDTIALRAKIRVTAVLGNFCRQYNYVIFTMKLGLNLNLKRSNIH
jgi:hypothetical protein